MIEISTDPLYQAFRDYLNGDSEGKIEIINEDFDDDHIDVSYFFRSSEELPQLEKLAIDQMRGKVLDIGAGAGAHSLIMQEMGLDVTAIDISPGSCEIMRERGISDVVCTSIMEFDTSSKFDSILMMMNGIGVAGSLVSLPELLNKLKGLMAEGGQIIFDSSDLIYLYTEDDSIYVDLNANYYGEGIYEMRYKGLSSGKFPWLYIDYPTVSEIADQCGLKSELLGEGGHFDYLAKLSTKNKC